MTGDSRDGIECASEVSSKRWRGFKRTVPGERREPPLPLTPTAALLPRRQAAPSLQGPSCRSSLRGSYVLSSIQLVYERKNAPFNLFLSISTRKSPTFKERMTTY